MSNKFKDSRLLVRIQEPSSYRFNPSHITIESLQEDFDAFLTHHPDFKQEHLFMEIDYSPGYYDEINIESTVVGLREETDEEYNARMAEEKEKRRVDALNAKKSREKAKLLKEEKEREEYERLKKKYEGT